jgi:hypothetical protein
VDPVNCKLFNRRVLRYIHYEAVASCLRARRLSHWGKTELRGT